MAVALMEVPEPEPEPLPPPSWCANRDEIEPEPADPVLPTELEIALSALVAADWNGIEIGAVLEAPVD